MPSRLPHKVMTMTWLTVLATTSAGLPQQGQAQTGLLDKMVLDAIPIRVISLPEEDDDDSENDEVSSYQAEELAPRPALEALTEPVESATDYLPEDTVALGEERISRYQQRLEEQMASGGSYNLAMGESLLDLGSAYEIIGNYDKALEAYEEAYHLNRIHKGLFNLDQVPIVQRITETHIALGQLEQAHQQQDYLHYLYSNKLTAEELDQANLLDTRLALAEWNSNIANTARNYQFASTLDFQLQRLLDADRNYTAVLNQLHAEKAFDDARIPHIEMQRARANFFTARLATLIGNVMLGSTRYFNDNSSRNGFTSVTDSTEAGLRRRLDFYKSTSYAAGKNALENRLDFLEAADSHNLEAIIRALVDLADWNLYYQRRGTAMDYYDQAFSLLQDERLENAQALRQTLFAPAVPVPLPGFIARPNSREDYGLSAGFPLRYQGVIDLEFSLNRYGSANRIEVLNSRQNDDNNDFERDLRRDIANTLYRPYFDDNGQVRDEVDIRVRYYYTHMPSPISVDNLEVRNDEGGMTKKAELMKDDWEPE